MIKNYQSGNLNSKICYEVEILKKLCKNKMNGLKESMKGNSNQRKELYKQQKIIFSFQNKRFQNLEDNQIRKKVLVNGGKQKILGGGCGTSRSIDTKSLKKISNIKLEKKSFADGFLEEYQKFNDKGKIALNIKEGQEIPMQYSIFQDCIHKYRIFMRRNVQQYKIMLLDLIEVFQIYVLSGSSSEEGLFQNEIQQLGKWILDMKESFDSESIKQPCLDLAFYFEILHKFNSQRKGIDKSKNKLLQVGSFISQIIQVGAAVFKGDFAEVMDKSLEIGKYLLEAYNKSKASQLFSHILDIYVKRVDQFKEKLWVLTLSQELEFYIDYFCNLSKQQEQKTDFVVIILIKINYYFCLAEEKDFADIRQKFPFSSAFIQKFLAKLIQKIDSKDNLENSIKEFFLFSISSPPFRFLTISILLKYYQIFLDTSDFSKNKDNVIVYLIYKYLCEKDKRVLLAYQTSAQFEEIYNSKIEDKEFLKQIEGMSKKRRDDFQTIFSHTIIKSNDGDEQNTNQVISNLEIIEERIDNQGDLGRLISNKLIEKWEKDVELRQKENIAQKDDVLIEVKDLYIQQSLTYEKGNIKLQGIQPSKQSFSLIDDKISTNQSQKALRLIVNNFLKSSWLDKDGGIKEEEITHQEPKEPLNAFKILGILAEGGTGKSMLLKKLETDLIDNSDEKDYIPLLIKCNSLDPLKPSIDEYLLKQGIKQNEIDTIKGSDRNKVILLDGYDEYSGKYFRVYSELKLDDWKNTKVIVTTRREKLTLNEACFNFSLDNEKGQIDESSFCLMKLEEFNKKDILEYCRGYFKQRRIHKEQTENEQQVNKDLSCIQDCMKNQQLENLLYLPINLYLFTRMMVDVESESQMQQIKHNISDQVGIQEVFFKEQFKREALDFIQSHMGTQQSSQRIIDIIANCYFEYFQMIAMKMFLNKGEKGIINFLQLQKDQIHFSLRKQIQKELSNKKQQDILINKIINYVNSKIITRVKEINFNTNQIQKKQSQVIEFKHKSLFEYFVSRAMKYDFDVHQTNIYTLSMQELQEFSINQKAILNIGQNQSEQQVLLKLYKLIKNEIESSEFQTIYCSDKIENNNRFIQYLKRSTIKKYDDISQIDIGASNLLSALFISKFSYQKLSLSLCSFSKAYISNPKCNEINFDRCNFNDANLQNSCINYDSCNTQSANFYAFQKVFDTQNTYSFNQVIWGKNDQLYSISNSGFINSFKVIDSRIQLQNSKQLSHTPLFQIVKINDQDFLVSSKYSLFLINSKNFEIKQSHKFKDSIKCITMIKESIVVILQNKNLFHGTFKDGFKYLKIIGEGLIYNQKTQILITYDKNFFQIWDTLKNFELVNKIYSHHSRDITSVAFSADGKYLVTSSQDKTCGIWNAEQDFKFINNIQGHTKAITTVTFSADGKYLVTGSEDNTCNIWNVEKGFELIDTIEDHINPITSVAFSEDGKYLATGSSDNTCKIWNSEKGFELVNTIQGHTHPINSVAFSEDGKYLATGSEDSTCKIWNAEKDFELINTIQGHTYSITSVAFSTDGKYLATGSEDSTCKIWNAEKNFELINTIQGHTYSIKSVAFSTDGKYLATSSADNTCKIWNAEKGFELINTIQGHTQVITYVAFSPDGKYLATCSHDDTCKIWNAEKDFELINTIQGIGFTSIAFSANGKYLATGLIDNICKIWNAEKGFELINIIQGYTNPIISVTFSVDGKYLATGSVDNTCKIWNAEKGFELINTIQGHTSWVRSVAFSKDGKHLVTGSEDKTCKIWNTEKGFELINAIQGHINPIISVAFSADGKYLATGSLDNTCKIWNAVKGFELINTIYGHTNSITSVAFSADGKYLATGSTDKTCKIWDAEKGFELINTIQVHTNKVFSVAFSADGKYLVTGSADNTCKILNAEKDFELINTIQGHTSWVKSVAFSTDGKYLVTGSEDSTCKIWNAEKGFELIKTIQSHTNPINSVAFSADGQYLVTGSEDSNCKIWNAQKGFELINTIQDHANTIASVAFSADGKYLATGSLDKTCKVWNAEKDFELINTIQSHNSWVRSVAFSTDGKYLVTGSDDNTCKIWNTEKGFELINTIQDHANPINSIAFSADGIYLVTGSEDNTYKIWNANKGFELINTIQGHTSWVRSVAFSADGKYLATGSEDNTCKIWNAEKGFELINKIQGHTKPITSVTFSADGKYLVTGSKDNTCKIWNTQKGFELINTIQEHTKAITSIAFSADGKYLATGSEDNTCKIWNGEKGFEFINTIQGHTNPITSIAFSAYGKYLATGSSDSTCKILNAEKGFELINTIQGQTYPITSITFSTDGKYLATGLLDKTCKIWNAEKGFELIKIIQGHTKAITSVAFSPDGKYLATGSDDNTCKIWNAEKKNLELYYYKNRQELNQNYSQKEMKLFENIFIL